MTQEASPHRSGTSVFARAGSLIWWLIALEGLFLVFTLPCWVLGLFVAPTSTTIPFFALCAVTIGPALSAMVFAWRRREIEDTGSSPWSRFWRGYKLNLKDCLLWWIPYVAILGLAGWLAGHSAVTKLPESMIWVYIIVALVLTLWAGHMMIITSAFSFRTKDAVKLSVYLLFRVFQSTAAYAAFALVCIGLTYLAGIWLPALLASLLSFAYVKAASKEMTTITEEFTPSQEPPDDDGDDMDWGSLSDDGETQD